MFPRYLINTFLYLKPVDFIFSKGDLTRYLVMLNLVDFRGIFGHVLSSSGILLTYL